MALSDHTPPIPRISNHGPANDKGGVCWLWVGLVGQSMDHSHTAHTAPKPQRFVACMLFLEGIAGACLFCMHATSEDIFWVVVGDFQGSLIIFSFAFPCTLDWHNASMPPLV